MTIEPSTMSELMSSIWRRGSRSLRVALGDTGTGLRRSGQVAGGSSEVRHSKMRHSEAGHSEAGHSEAPHFGKRTGGIGHFGKGGRGGNKGTRARAGGAEGAGGD